MHKEISSLIERIDDPTLSHADIIPWGCPVPSFGDPSKSKIATLGLNPSNREFVDVNGNELEGDNRRFHTLASLGLADWSKAKRNHLEQIIDLCRKYFFRNPYDGWFKKLDNIISGTSFSYYNLSSQACHLDLVPYATASKWTDLSPHQRSVLIEETGDILGLVLRNSPVGILVLNGRTVVETLQKVADVEFERIEMPDWTLPRKSSRGVSGYSYKGRIKNLGGVKLSREILVLGYNHNIQSSFGVTTQVQTAIRNWISKNAEKELA